MSSFPSARQSNRILLGLAAGAGVAGSLHADVIETASYNLGPVSEAAELQDTLVQTATVTLDANNWFNTNLDSGTVGGPVLNKVLAPTDGYVELEVVSAIGQFNGLSFTNVVNGQVVDASSFFSSTGVLNISGTQSDLFGLQLDEPSGPTNYGWMQVDNFSSNGSDHATIDLVWDESGGSVVAGVGFPQNQSVPDAPQMPAEAAIMGVFLAGSAAAFRRRQAKLLASSAR